MGTLLTGQDVRKRSASYEDSSATEYRFLAELTALSQKYRLGIAGDAVLFIMEWDDDERVYTSDGESKLFFR